VKLSETGRRLIEALEGFGAQPYRNVLGSWAIGFGHTYGVTEQTPPIGRAQADDLLDQDITGSYGPAIDALGLAFTQNQFDALCSFVYQLGVGVLSRRSPFGSQLVARDWVAAGNAMLLYDQLAGVAVAELQHRRSLERALFLAPPAPAASSLAVLNAPERAEAQSYESALAHAPVDPEQLARMREQLALLRQLVWVAAVRGQESDGSPVKAGWEIDLRRERYAVLAKLSGWAT
jgi:lysozyme